MPDEIHAVGGAFEWNESAFAALVSDHGPIAAYVRQKAELVTQEAKRLAPVSPKGSNGRPSGWLRSHIGFKVGADAQGVYADVYSAALSPAGAPYGLFQEVGTSKMKAQPHLRPALDILR